MKWIGSNKNVTVFQDLQSVERILRQKKQLTQRQGIEFWVYNNA